jgi:cellulose synthase/poly-beta-1,6-N-acetylglucosamine synthase-like glycosyltransferase
MAFAAGWIIVTVSGVALAAPALVFLVALLSPRRRTPVASPAAEAQRLLFLVPAHDEELLIEECVRSLVGMDYPADRLLVVVIADNCSDRTAELARAAGARVLERADLTLRGKPRALAWALDQLKAEPYDAGIIVDADSVVEPGFARAVDTLGPLGEDAAQAYFATRNEDENWLTLLAGVLARAKYEVVYPVKDRAGLNCPLTGNGMVFGAGPLKRDGWTAFSLTENWELYGDYTARGRRIVYAHGARLLSQEVRSLGQGRTQRQRWIRGRREALRRFAGPLARSTRIGLLQKLDAILELGLPGPVIHLTLVFGILLLAGLLLKGTLGAVLATAALLSVAPMLAATAIVVWRHPRRGAVLLAMTRVPAYAVWRIAVALGARAAGREWIKTARHDTSSAPRPSDQTSR